MLADPPTVAMAALVVEFADAIGLDSFDLNGHWFGGCVAAYLAARWPERVRKLVLTAFGTHRSPLERMLLEAAQRSNTLALGFSQPWLNISQPWLNTFRPAATALLSNPPFPQLLASWFMDRVPGDQTLLREGVA